MTTRKRKIKTKTESKKSRGLLSKMTFFFVLFLFVSVIVYILFFSGLLSITSVAITGTENIVDEKISLEINAALDGKYARAVDKNNLLLVNTTRIKEDMKKKFKKIEQIKITRKFPSGLSVEITERKPMLILFSDDQYFILDEKGTAFELITSDSSDYMDENWMILRDNSNKRVEINESALADDLVDFIAALRDQLKNSLDIEIERESETPNKMSYDIRTRTREGWAIYFNASLDSNKQIETLRAVLENKLNQEDRSNLEYVDLRSENKAFYKFREGSQEEMKPEEEKKNEGQSKDDEKKDEKKKKKK